jgi:8-oxo-dGTP diphosphatase
MGEPKHTLVVSALVRNGWGDIVLIRSPKRGWEIPQGRVEEGEALVDALRREVREETGLEVDVGPLAALYSKLSPPSALIFCFLTTFRGGVPTTSDESLEVGWFAPDEALGLVEHPVNRERLEAPLAYSGRLVYRSYETKPYRVTGDAFMDGV